MKLYARLGKIAKVCFIIWCTCGCKNVDLKTKLELSSKMPKWSQLYVEIYDLTQEIQNVKKQIQSNKNEINQKFLQIEDSTLAEQIAVYKNQYFQQLEIFNQIYEKSKKLHASYVKERTLYNYWLNTVQNDLISDDEALSQSKIFDKKYEKLRKEYYVLRNELRQYIQKTNEMSEKLSELMPELVGIKFRLKN
jgi:hypothetical protein